MGGGTSVIDKYSDNSSASFGIETAVNQNSTSAPLSALVDRLRVFQNSMSGEVIVLVDNGIEKFTEVSDPGKWFELPLSKLQTKYLLATKLTVATESSLSSPGIPDKIYSLSRSESTNYLSNSNRHTSVPTLNSLQQVSSLWNDSHDKSSSISTLRAASDSKESDHNSKLHYRSSSRFSSDSEPSPKRFSLQHAYVIAICYIHPYSCFF